MTEETQNPITPQEFAKKIKAKYPQYANIDDVTLAKKMVEKYPEYSSQVTFAEKKNPNGTVSTQKKSGESVPTNGSLGLPSPNNPLQVKKPFESTPKKEQKTAPSKFKEGSMSWNLEKLKKSNPEIETKFDEYKKAQQVPVDFIEKTKAEVEDAYNNKGFFNGLKTGLSKAINYIVNPVDDLIETDQFADERKVVEAKIKKEQSLAKAQKKTAPIYNQSQIDQMVKNEKINKLVKSQKETQVRSFLEDQDKNYTADEFGKTTRERLNIYNIQELSSLSETDKENLKKQNVVLPALSNSMQKIKEYNEKIAKKIPLSPIEVEDYKNQFAKFEDLTLEASELKKEFSTNREKIKDSKEALDLFKRDYSFARHIKNLEATTKEIASGIAGFEDYLLESSDFVADKLGIIKPSTLMSPVRDVVRGVSQDLTKEAEQLKSETAKPIKVEDINSFDDLGSWLGDTAVSQAPIFALIATGGPGIATLGASSTGQKYESMVDEMIPKPNQWTRNYSKGQLLGIPAIYGASEILSASVDFYLLKNASKVYNSVGKPERKMIVDGMAKKILETSGNIAKSSIIEAGDEMFTQGVQNFADIYIGGDKSKKMTDGMLDAGVAGAVMGAFINIAPLAVEKATKPFSKNDDTQKTASEIMSLQMQLDNKGLAENSRKVIEEQLEKAKTKLNTQLEKRVVDLKTLSNAQFREINLIERTQANIRQKATDIKEDKSIDVDMKKQILKNLESEFNANEQRRVDLLERGASVQLEKLSDEEKQKYQEKANRVLTKEKNPDGTKENVKINQEEIDKKAIELYKIDQVKNQSKLNEQIQTTTSETEQKTQFKAKVQENIQEDSAIDNNQEKQEIKDKFEKIADIYNSIKEEQEKDIPNKEYILKLKRQRTDFLKGNTTIEFIDKNFKEIVKQLEDFGTLNKKGDC